MNYQKEVTANPFRLKMVGFEVPFHGRLWVPGDKADSKLNKPSVLATPTCSSEPSRGLFRKPVGNVSLGTPRGHPLNNRYAGTYEFSGDQERIVPFAVL
jgi:hypothetical protein